MIQGRYRPGRMRSNQASYDPSLGPGNVADNSLVNSSLALHQHRQQVSPSKTSQKDYISTDQSERVKQCLWISSTPLSHPNLIRTNSVQRGSISIHSCWTSYSGSMMLKLVIPLWGQERRTLWLKSRGV